MAKDEKDSIEDRLFAIQDKTSEERGLVACFLALENLIIAIQTDAQEFIERAARERTDLRREIVKRGQHESGSKSFIPTSKRVLFLRNENDRPRLTWHVSWYSRRGTGARFSSLKSTKTGTPLRDILEGAHPDEIDLLTSHEMSVRAINKRWAGIAAIRRSIRMHTLTLLNARANAAQVDGTGAVGAA